MKIFKFGILVFGFLISSSLIVHANGLVSAKITDGWIEKDQKLIFGLKIDLDKNLFFQWLYLLIGMVFNPKTLIFIVVFVIFLVFNQKALFLIVIFVICGGFQ